VYKDHCINSFDYNLHRFIHPFIHSSIAPTTSAMSIPTPALTMLTTLADDPRNKLPDWYLELRTKARNLCSAHDAAGALSLVAQDRDWQQFPGVLTNPVDVAAAS
jgi:hypothetical protein